MLIKTLCAAALIALPATGAFAQQTPDKHVDMPVGAQTGKVVREAVAALPPSAANAAVPVSANELTIFNNPASPYVTDAVSGPLAGTNIVVTNGPVPDTAETRAKYKPLSNAGNRTPATGN